MTAPRIKAALIELRKLQYWLNTDADVLAEMTPEVRSDHEHIVAAVNRAIAALTGSNEDER